MSTTLNIEVYFDLICPWCLIGKRHLATALKRFQGLHPEVPVRVVWTGYPLLPEMPPEGLPYNEFYERRLGGKAAVAARRVQVQAAARMAGFQFNFDAIRVMPNTLAAHGLIRRLQEDGNPEHVDALIEKLFAAYFLEGRDIGDPDVLAGLALDCKPESRNSSAMPSLSGQCHAHPVSGVPFFVFNDRLAISGANPPDILLSAMQDCSIAV